MELQARRKYEKFQVLTAASIMFRVVFWDTAVIIPDDGGSTHL
jgi:hypothetical protein